MSAPGRRWDHMSPRPEDVDHAPTCRCVECAFLQHAPLQTPSRTVYDDDDPADVHGESNFFDHFGRRGQ